MTSMTSLELAEGDGGGDGAGLCKRARSVELAVCVSDAASARAAVDGGADRVYWAAEVSQLDGGSADPARLADVVREVKDAGVTFGIRTPRVTTSREWFETRWLLERLADKGIDHVLVHHPGTLSLARAVCPGAGVIADYGFNVLNSSAVGLLAELGAAEVTVSNEAGLADVRAMAAASPLRLELLAHGPVCGMLIDHCVIALHASASGRKDDCRAPCRHVAFGLRDRFGQTRPVIADQHCRNHLMTAHDLAILPALEKFLLRGVGSIRIEGQFYAAEQIGVLTRAYRQRLNALARNAAHGVDGDGPRQVPDGGDGLCTWEDVVRVSDRPLNFGAYGRSIVRSRSTAQVMLEAVSG